MNIFLRNIFLYLLVYLFVCLVIHSSVVMRL